MKIARRFFIVVTNQLTSSKQHPNLVTISHALNGNHYRTMTSSQMCKSPWLTSSLNAILGFLVQLLVRISCSIELLCATAMSLFKIIRYVVSLGTATGEPVKGCVLAGLGSVILADRTIKEPGHHVDFGQLTPAIVHSDSRLSKPGNGYKVLPSVFCVATAAIYSLMSHSIKPM